MNLLFICDEYPPGKHGGIGSAVQTLARELVRQGHHVVVAGMYDRGYGGLDEFEDQGVKVYRFRRKLSAAWLGDRYSFSVKIAYRFLKLSGLFYLDIRSSIRKFHFFLEKIISAHRIDIVEMPDFNDYTAYCLKPVYFPKLSVPVTIKIHGTLTHIYNEAGKRVSNAVYLSEKHLFDQATSVSSVSEYAARKAQELFDYEKPIKVLYNGIEILTGTDGFPSAKQKLVIFSGALVPAKGIYQLLKAWNHVHKIIPDAKLRIYGKGPVHKLRKLIHPDSEASVDFKGHVSRDLLIQNLASASLAVFPSYSECFSLAPMEAMSMGTPVIYTTRTSGPELIQNGVNGLLADPDDLDDLADNIIRLLQNPELSETLGSNGRKLIHERFNISVIAAEHISYYKTLTRL